MTSLEVWENLISSHPLPCFILRRNNRKEGVPSPITPFLLVVFYNMQRIQWQCSANLTTNVQSGCVFLPQGMNIKNIVTIHRSPGYEPDIHFFRILRT